jgi:hypothetical protein
LRYRAKWTSKRGVHGKGDNARNAILARIRKTAIGAEA